MHCFSFVLFLFSFRRRWFALGVTRVDAVHRVVVMNPKPEIMYHVSILAGKGIAVHVAWGRSHREYQAVSNGMNTIHWFGNRAADELAGRAAAEHAVSEFDVLRMQDCDKLFRDIIGRCFAIELQCEAIAPPKRDKYVPKLSRSWRRLRHLMVQSHHVFFGKKVSFHLYVCLVAKLV